MWNKLASIILFPATLAMLVLLFTAVLLACLVELFYEAWQWLNRKIKELK